MDSLSSDQGSKIKMNSLISDRLRLLCEASITQTDHLYIPRVCPQVFHWIYSRINRKFESSSMQTDDSSMSTDTSSSMEAVDSSMSTDTSSYKTSHTRYYSKHCCAKENGLIVFLELSFHVKIIIVLVTASESHFTADLVKRILADLLVK